ncbi:MAG: GNAT family N-acetyltransferase [Oscillospiraceae bacterium]|nr:GNAT family N-acetyltransferase [Oscillospiraceae bacterium]
MTIRRAEEKDIPRLGSLLLQVCRVHNTGRPDLFRTGGRKYDDQELRELLKDEGRPVLVAEDENGWVAGYAFCVYQVHKNEGSFNDMTTLYLDDLCVDESCRGTGVGYELYQAVLDLARRTGCYNVTLNVWSCNPSAMRFYEKCGLQQQKIGMEKIL